MARIERGRRGWLVVSIFISIAVPAPAFGQGAGGQSATQAVALFEEASRLFEEKKFDLACPKFLQSYELDPTKAGVLYALAECYTAAGKIASAVVRYGEYIRAVDGLPADARARHDERVQRAKAQQAALAPEVPEVTFVVPEGASSNTRVAVDGTALDAAAWRAPVRVDPGEHVVTVQSPGGPEKRQSFRIERGGKERVVLEVASPGPAGAAPSAVVVGPPAQASPDRGMSGWKVGAIAGFGVGAVGVVVGAITGGMVFGEKKPIGEVCSNTDSDSDIECKTDKDVTRVQDAKTLGAVSTVAVGVGLAGIAAGVLLLVLEPKKPAAGRAGAFIAVGPTSLGPEGVVLGAKGAW
jgi:hypothetical protein